MTTPVFNPGDVLGGRFQILVPLASGGMGQGFEAEDLHLKRRVALKVFLHPADQDEPAVERFVRDAREAAQLEGEQMAKVLDVGRLDFGAPYLVLELLEGKNLQALVAERGALAVRDAVDYVMEACEALDEAHRAGLVHRDLKPANFLYCRKITGETTIKLLDFGILQRPSNPPLNMSPEQLGASAELDHRTDIWSLGTVLFELVTGQPVWRATSASELVLQITSDPPPSMQDIEPSIPDGFAVIVNRCLEKDPARRYQRIADLAAALATFGGDRAKASLANLALPQAGVAIGVGSVLTPTLTITPRDSSPHAARPPVAPALRDEPAVARRGRSMLVVSGLALLALAALGAARWMTATAPPSPEFASASARRAPVAAPSLVTAVHTAHQAPHALQATQVPPAVQSSTTPSEPPKRQKKATAPRQLPSAKSDCECAPSAPQVAPRREPSRPVDDPFASRL